MTLAGADIATVVVAALLAAWLALYVLARPAARTAAPPAPQGAPMALLFDGGALHHATEPAMAELALAPGHHGWDDLRERLKDRFPDLPHWPGEHETGSVILTARDAGDRLRLRWREGLCWAILDPAGGDPAALGDLAALQRASDSDPCPVWQTTPETDAPLWTNAAFRALPDTAQAALLEHATCAGPVPDTASPRRLALSLRGSSGTGQTWYEIASDYCGAVTVHRALPATALVEAEAAQQTFIQTLGKTFAHLPVGLAIFDRNGQLALFNPALLDLTGLGAAFLSARPTVLSFFDQLRETRHMPEPKDYRAWRHQIAALSAVSTEAPYQETWTLEDGRTYAVQGRPHPDGAAAFLFEDISAEISLTRNFRAELELSQTLLDRVEDGLVVFTVSGVLTFCNASYRRFWQHNPESAFADVTIEDCIALWRGVAGSDLPWQDIARQVHSFGDRAPVIATLSRHGDPWLRLEAEAIAHGGTVIRFRPAAAVQEPAQRGACA